MFPVAIAIFGGGFISGDKLEWRPFVEPLTHCGIAVVAISYRLFPDHPWPAPLVDVVNALNWLASGANGWPLDARRVALIGRSAGAYIALAVAAGMAGRLPMPVAAVVAEGAPTAMPYSEWGGTWLGYLGRYFAGIPEADLDLSRRVHANFPPTLFLTGEHDEDAPPTNAHRMADSLAAQHRPVRVEIVPHAGHGALEAAPDRCLRAIADWLTAWL